MKPRFQQEETEITEKWFCASLFPRCLLFKSACLMKRKSLEERTNETKISTGGNGDNREMVLCFSVPSVASCSNPLVL